VAFAAVPVLAKGHPHRSGGNHEVSGYVRSNGTYVTPHIQKNPNATKLDNYSTKGNINPYTGKAGTVEPYAMKPTQNPH